ncbi:MAG TPA: energy transducer TonB [Acidimicrobiales bacterium]|nr:energy transducer TonB [Acidimicrobiales bacterium]
MPAPPPPPPPVAREAPSVTSAEAVAAPGAMVDAGRLVAGRGDGGATKGGGAVGAAGGAADLTGRSGLPAGNGETRAAGGAGDGRGQASGGGRGAGGGSGAGGGVGSGADTVAAHSGRGTAEVGDLLRAMRRQIERAKVYPEAARRREVEGTVELRFRVAPDGSVQAVEVVQSSGYTILDESAVRTIQRAAPYPVLAGWIQIPLAYRLDR